MQKLFILAALFMFSTATLVGCGGATTEVIEPVSEEDGVMAEDQMKMYEEAMKKGGSSRANAGN